MAPPGIRGQPVRGPCLGTSPSFAGLGVDSGGGRSRKSSNPGTIWAKCSRGSKEIVSIRPCVVRRLIGVVMGSNFDLASLGTVDQVSAPDPSGLAGEPVTVCRPRREIVHGSGPHLDGETQSLLRYRLRAAALILFVRFSVFLVRHVTGVLTGEPLDPLLLGAHVFVVLVLSGSLFPLCRRCPVSMRKLRVAELVIFGLPALFFLLLSTAAPCPTLLATTCRHPCRSGCCSSSRTGCSFRTRGAGPLW